MALFGTTVNTINTQCGRATRCTNQFFSSITRSCFSSFILLLLGKSVHQVWSRERCIITSLCLFFNYVAAKNNMGVGSKHLSSNFTAAVARSASSLDFTVIFFFVFIVITLAILHGQTDLKLQRVVRGERSEPDLNRRPSGSQAKSPRTELLPPPSTVFDVLWEHAAFTLFEMCRSPRTDKMNVFMNIILSKCKLNPYKELETVQFCFWEFCSTC